MKKKSTHFSEWRSEGERYSCGGNNRLGIFQRASMAGAK